MDYRKTAREIYEHVGKKENIISAAHCATRLRLVIADNEKADKDAVENINGVKGVFFAQGQMQIILGTGVVNKVYDEFIQIAGISESSKEELKQVAASRANPFQRLIKTLGDIFVPIIPAIVASGFLMGIMEALNFMVNNGYLNIDTSGSIYTFAQLFSNGAEILIHVGINTVELGGKFYTSHVKEGDRVRIGQVMLTFDMEKIKEAGYDLTTPMIITNSDDYQEIRILKTGNVIKQDAVLEIKES